MKNRDVLKIKWLGVLVLSLLHTVFGVMSVKIFAVLETFDFSKAGSMSLFGGIFFMPLLYFVGAKLFNRNVATVFDLFTPCMIFIVMCARINCIVSGCCLGAYISGDAGYRYPMRELEVLFYILLLTYLFTRAPKTKIFGRYYPLYMAAYGAFRFVTEFFRESDSAGILHISHIWATVSFLLGLAICFELPSQSKDKVHSKKKHKDNHP